MGRVVSLESEWTTWTVSSGGTPVLVLGEARHEDGIQSPTESRCNRFAHETTDVIDLYSVDSDGSIPVRPFLHQVLFNGPNGEIVRVRGLFDDGAMVGVMDLTVFSKIRKRLGSITPSKRCLRMANGVIVPSL